MGAKLAIPVFYDCEASCIGGLPIEIGWAFFDVSSGEIKSESHIIKPPASWNMEEVWDPDAAKLHKISRDQLMKCGRIPLEIARRMNDVLAGRSLFSDAPKDDERWLRIVFDEAGIEPAFAVRGLHAEALMTEFAATLGWDNAGYIAAKMEARRAAPREHRAESDARNLAQLWLIIARGPSSRI